MRNVTILVNILMTMGLIFSMFKYYCNSCFYIIHFFKNNNTILLEIDTVLIVSLWMIIKNFTDIKLLPMFLRWSTKKTRDRPDGPLCLLGRLFYSQLQIINTKKKKMMTFCLISLDHPLNICDGLTRWTFVPLGQKLTYKISNLNNLKVCLESNQLIDVNRCNIKNQHHHHDLTRACRGGKYVCLVRIRTTDKFQSNPSTSFRINELESNKHDADKSTIKK